MARKPALSNKSFLQSIFQPSKHQTPKGLRKRSATKTSGRNARRVRAFNNLTPAKQAILDKANQREAYLRGDTTLTEAKNSLRAEAIRNGWTAPVTRTTSIEHHISSLVQRATGRNIDPDKLHQRVNAMTPEQRREASSLTFAELQQRASDNDNLIETDDGDTNPFWYRD